jgi:hypothetical protein
MQYMKVDMRNELRRLARGKTTRVPAKVLAGWALDHVGAEKRAHGDSVRWLEALYGLPDPRP